LILTKVRPTSDINALPSHTPAKATTDGKEQLAAVSHPTRTPTTEGRSADSRIELELLSAPKATRTGPGRGKQGNTELPSFQRATLAELTGYKMKGYRLKKLAEIGPEHQEE
jgi:hypothetical protein